MTAQEAAQAFSTPLRLRLIRHYLDHAGSQTAAAEALGVRTSVVSLNTKALLALGIVVRDGRNNTIDQARLQELTTALVAYLNPPAAPHSGRA